MAQDIRKLAETTQERIRELAYLMWESAGRQQGMAVEYWLAAEREVVATLQNATDAMMGKRSSTAAKAEPPAESPKAEPP
ncbi:MAG: DUF2934 domain-containing protein, partial [Rhodospirillales bacterium]